MQTNLYARVKKKGIEVRRAAEVGVWKPVFSNIGGFIHDNIPSLLVEADPQICEEITDYFAHRNNVVLHAKAIAEQRGTLTLVKAEGSSFLSHLTASPAIINDGNVPGASHSIEVEAIPFSDIDPGDIDVMSIDIEGAEWGVISTMLSRPKVISVETHGGIYINPHMDDIKGWMFDNNYRLWYMDKSDSVYVNGDVSLDRADAVLLHYTTLKNNVKKIKKRISRTLRGK